MDAVDVNADNGAGVDVGNEIGVPVPAVEGATTDATIAVCSGAIAMIFECMTTAPTAASGIMSDVTIFRITM